MLSETLARLSDNPIAIKIQGKGLVYKVDLRGDIEQNVDDIKLRVHGFIRFGIWNSEGEFNSTYSLRGIDRAFLNHRISFSKISFVEEYLQEQDTLKYRKNDQAYKEISIHSEPVFDPLPLIFKLLTLNPTEDVVYDGQILVGGKQNPFKFEQNKNEIKVHVSGRPLFYGTIKDGLIEVELAKFKAKLILQRV